MGVSQKAAEWLRYHLVGQWELFHAPLNDEISGRCAQEFTLRTAYSKKHYKGQLDWGHTKRLALLGECITVKEKVNMSLDTLGVLHRVSKANKVNKYRNYSRYNKFTKFNSRY
jgi:hypothetical protein